MDNICEHLTTPLYYVTVTNNWFTEQGLPHVTCCISIARDKKGNKINFIFDTEEQLKLWYFCRCQAEFKYKVAYIIQVTQLPK
jgi:hypothetical protein